MLKERDKLFIREQVDKIIKALDKLTKEVKKIVPHERIGPM